MTQAELDLMLILSVENNIIEMVEYFVNRGANINAVGPQNKRPVIMSALYITAKSMTGKHAGIEIAQYLIHNGADLCATNDDGENFLDRLFLKRGFEPIKYTFKEYDPMRNWIKEYDTQKLIIEKHPISYLTLHRHNELHPKIKEDYKHILYSYQMNLL